MGGLQSARGFLSDVVMNVYGKEADAECKWRFIFTAFCFLKEPAVLMKRCFVQRAEEVKMKEEFFFGKVPSMLCWIDSKITHTHTHTHTHTGSFLSVPNDLIRVTRA